MKSRVSAFIFATATAFVAVLPGSVLMTDASAWASPSPVFRDANAALRKAFRIDVAKTVFSGVNPANGNACDILIEDQRFSDASKDDLSIAARFEGDQETHLLFRSGPASDGLEITKGVSLLKISSHPDDHVEKNVSEGAQELILRDWSPKAWPTVSFSSGRWHLKNSEITCSNLKRVGG